MLSLELLAMRAGALVGAVALVFFSGAHWQKQRSDAKRLQAVEEAREKEANWQTDVAALVEVKDDEVRRITAARDDALRRLRERPAERMPATASCSANGAGATGAQLSEPDAAAFAGLAADADRTAADLRACQAWVKAVTGSASDR